jgi:hypothetical protein
MSGLNSDQKMALFLEAVSVEDAVAVVLSPEFFEDAKEWPNIVLNFGTESRSAESPDKLATDAIDLLYKYEGVTAYEKEVARIYGVPVFIKPIGSTFQVYHSQQEVMACLSYK